MLKIILACALTLTGAACTTVQPLTGFPTAPSLCMTPAERPTPLPAGEGSPSAADALATVTGNYARHHRTADRLDCLQGWIREQSAITP